MNILSQEFVAPAGAMILTLILYIFFFDEKKKILILFISIACLGSAIEILATIKGVTVATMISGPIVVDQSGGLNSQTIEILRMGGMIVLAALISAAMVRYIIKVENTIVSNIGIILYSLGGVQVVFYTLPALISDKVTLVVAILGYCFTVGAICTMFHDEGDSSFGDSEEPEEE